MKAPTTLLAAIFLLLAISVQAQWAFGIKGSFVRSSQNIVPALTHLGYNDYSQTINGYGTSFSFYYHVVKYLQIGIEPGLVRRGNRTADYSVINGDPFDCWNFENNNLNPECIVERYGDTQLFASYVQAPILLKGILPICKDRLSIFAKIGGGFSWLFYAQQEHNFQLFGPYFQSRTIDLEEEIYIKRWDRAWQIGGGLDLKMGPGQFSLETLLYQGAKDFYEYTKSRTRSFSYSLGYQIYL